MSIFRRRTDGGEPSVRVTPSDAEELSSVRGLELELGEARSRVAALEKDNERLRREASDAAELGSRAAANSLVKMISNPLAHLSAQVHLSRQDDCELTVSDLAGGADALLRALAAAGVRLEGEVGEEVAFNPELHLPLGGALSAGANVAVRSPGVIGPDGTVLRKATVEQT